MGIKENKAILQRYFDEVLNREDYSRIDEFMDENFNGRPGEVSIDGKEAHIQFFQQARKVFPDMRIETRELIAEGDKVVALSTWHLTHTGEDFMGFPASGKSCTSEVVAIYSFKNGKLVSGRVISNLLPAYKQLGIVPVWSKEEE